MVQTAVGDVIVALVGVFQTALTGQASDGGDVDVLFPGVDVNIDDEFAAVAHNGPDGTRPGVAGSTERSKMGNYAMSESFVVNCVLTAGTGDTGPAAMFATLNLVTGWYNAISAAIATDQLLGGAVKRPGMAEVNGFELYPSTEQGGSVTLLFGVHIVGSWSQ